MTQDTGRAHPSDRATQASPEPASGLGDTASVPCAFTPGPWEIRRQSNVIAQADGGPFVCDLNGVLGHDANLIAAAPELLAAAEAQERLWEYVGDEPHKQIKVVQQMRRAALAKARGQ